MSIPVLILGSSGSGKSRSLKRLLPQETLLIQAMAKPLPFKEAKEAGWKIFDRDAREGNMFVTDDATDIRRLMEATKRKIVVIDDFQYVMANEFMRRSVEKGYDKFTEIGRNAWEIMLLASMLPADVRVYILAHTDVNDMGVIKMKTIGRMLDEKITVEGMFTIVLRCLVRDGAHYFSTRNNGHDTVKAPEGMFDDELIENDLAAVDNAVRDYYGIV